MTLIVKKFGGTSLATSSHILHQARNIRSEIKKGNSIVIIVSAMNKTTDELHLLANEISSLPNSREMDMLLTTGERVSMSLFSMALNSLQIKSCSFTGSQVGIITTSKHNDARILEIRGSRLKEAINNGITPVIAGFQGVSNSREITTLGRGGSDTTAAAVAAYLNADACEIFTDVDGVYTADPRIVYNAKHIGKISYDEMLAMASMGSRVLHPRAVEIARKHKIPLIVKSSFNQGEGTMIVDRDSIERSEIRSISHTDNLTMIILKSKENVINIVKSLSDSGIKIQFMIKKSINHISFIVDSNNVNIVLSKVENNCESVNINNDMSAISIIGYGINDSDEARNSLISITDKYKEEIDSIMFSELAVTIIIKTAFRDRIITESARLFQLENND